MVHESSGAERRVEIGAVEVSDKVESLLEIDLDGVGLQLGGGEPVFDGVEFAADAILLGLEQVERDGSGVVGFEEFRPLVEETALPGDETLAVGDLGLTEGGDLLEDDLLGLESKIAA